MTRALLPLACLCLAGALSGCASDRLSAGECRAADWRAQGIEDGRAGQPAAYFTRYVEDCAGAPTPDRTAWSAGRQDGLAHYCTPAGAYAAGREGRAYSGVCPDPVNPEVLEANSHGLTYDKMKRRIADLERLERDYRYACPPGVGRFGRVSRCSSFGGYGGFYGADPRVRAELRQLREEIIYFSSWPPPGGEVIGGGF